MYSDLKRLKDTLNEFCQGSMDVSTFCQRFESLWNFEVERLSFSSEELAALDALFDEVALFSPLPRAEWGYPGYRDESQVRLAASFALRVVESRRPSTDTA